MTNVKINTTKHRKTETVDFIKSTRILTAD